MRIVNRWPDWKLEAYGHRYFLTRLPDGLVYEFSSPHDAGAVEDSHLLMARTEPLLTAKIEA